MKADSKTKAPDSTAETKPSTSDSKTTGNAAISATAAPPAEKRTQITSAIRQEKVEEVTNVNLTISIGTTVPAGVRSVRGFPFERVPYPQRLTRTQVRVVTRSALPPMSRHRQLDRLRPKGAMN